MPCIDAITPSWPKRGMSTALRCCACSTRQRRSFLAGFALKAPRRCSASRGWRGRRSRGRRAGSRWRSRAAPSPRSSATGRGVEPGAVRLVGVRLEQPRAARAERAVDLPLDRADGEMPVAVVDRPVLRELRRLRLRCPPRTITQSRTPILPSSTIFFIRSMVANDDPASWNVVMPFDSASCGRELQRPCALAARSAGVGAPARGSEPCRGLAQSPVGSPSASFRISPPAGVGRRPGDARELPSPSR